MQSAIFEQNQVKSDQANQAGILNKKNEQKPWHQQGIFASPTRQIQGGGTADHPGQTPPIFHDFSKIPILSSSPVRIQPKLSINTPGDKYEQEADRVAEQVMRMPAPKLQRKCAHCEEKGKSSLKRKENRNFLHTNSLPQIQRKCAKCEEENKKKLQRKEATRTSSADTSTMSAPPIVHEVLNSTGQPLDDSTRTFMESRFGQDFSHVRVHTDSRAVESAKSVQANAYTVGNNLVFNEGQFNPHSSGGRQLMAHELMHVVQQADGSSNVLQKHEEKVLVAQESDSLQDIQGYPMYALLEALMRFSEKKNKDGINILSNEVEGHLVGGLRLILAMRTVKAKFTDSVGAFLEKNKIALEMELPKDQVDDIWRFLGVPPLSEIQGLSMSNLLIRLRNSPEIILEDEEKGRNVGGVRLVTAMRAVRALKQRSLIDFLTINKRQIEALPADQFTSILTFLSIPVEDESTRKIINTGLEVNVNIIAPTSIRIPGEIGILSEGEIQFDDPISSTTISDFEERLLEDKSTINGVVLDPDTGETIGYQLPGTTGLTKLVDREGVVVWVSESGLEQPIVDPIDFTPTPGAVVGIAKGATKAVVGIYGKLILKGATKGVLKKGTGSGILVKMSAINKMRSVSKSIAKKGLSTLTEAKAFIKLVESGGKVSRTLSKQAAEKLVKHYDRGRPSMAMALNEAGIIGPFESFQIFTRGYGGAYQAHHIVEQSVLKHFGYDVGKAPSIILSSAEHIPISRRLAEKILKGELEYMTKRQILNEYKLTYKNYPTWIAEVEKYFR